MTLFAITSGQSATIQEGGTKSETVYVKDSNVSLSDFIEDNADALATDWRLFAERMAAGEVKPFPTELENPLRKIMLEIAGDMRQQQSVKQRTDKSRGDSPDNTLGLTTEARAHAETRLEQGFTLDQMVAEYRALRAYIARRWTSDRCAFLASDIDDLLRFDEAIDQALTESIGHFSARLARLNDLFVGVLAHDLRTPLQAVDMSAECIGRGVATPAQCVEASGRIQRSVKRMQTMVESLLVLTRARLGQPLPVTVASANLGEICKEAGDELRAVFPRAPISVRLVGDLRGVWDAGLLAQLVSNLLGNAIRHGDPERSIELTANGDDSDNVEICVLNHGPQIPTGMLPLLFEPLIRSSQESKATGSAKGLGLGLFIVKQIATAHGGDVVATSDIDHTEFRVRLPRCRSQHDSHP
jgi:signal transduction histidine kinase